MAEADFGADFRRVDDVEGSMSTSRSEIDPLILREGVVRSALGFVVVEKDIGLRSFIELEFGMAGSGAEVSGVAAAVGI